MTDWPSQRECDEFYGNPRGRWGSHPSSTWMKKNIIYIAPPYPMWMGGTPITRITIHRLAAHSLVKVLRNLQERYRDPSVIAGEWQERMREDGVTEYCGSFNYRTMRTSSRLSMHAYGAAIDFDAEHNQFHSYRHRFTESSPIVQCFEEEGWTWGGRWNAPDAMHFQAARVI